MKVFLNKYKSSKGAKDFSWNFISFLIVGISGFLLNIIIGKTSGVAALGLFNQVIAIYILFSQFSVFGIHYSILKHTSEHHQDKELCSTVINSGLLLIVATSFVTSVLIFFLAKPIAVIMNNHNLYAGIIMIIPGLFFFSINKAILAVANSFEHMKFYAVMQGLRYLLIILAVYFVIAYKIGDIYLPGAFSVAEFFLTFFLVIYIFKNHAVNTFKYISFDWIKKHFTFGLKGFLSGTIVELNSKVDILILGYFSNDYTVGIYSMASMIAEGAAQVITIMRNLVNPKLTKLYCQKNTTELNSLFKKVGKASLVIMTIICSTSVLIYPLLIKYLVADVAFMPGIWVLALLSIGIVLSSHLAPFDMILLQSGHPTSQTAFRFATVFLNITLNVLLIPVLGMYGASIATAVSLILSNLLLVFMVKKVVKITIKTI